MSDLQTRLRALGLMVTAAELDDLIALATKKRWGPQQIIEHIVEVEEKDRARRGLERRRARSRLDRFKPIADFDWDWPKKIDRALVTKTAPKRRGQERKGWSSRMASSSSWATRRRTPGCR